MSIRQQKARHNHSTVPTHLFKRSDIETYLQARNKVCRRGTSQTPCYSPEGGCLSTPTQPSPAAGHMGWLRHPTMRRRDPRQPPPALALLQHPTTKPGCLLRHHLGWVAPRVRDGASPNHPSYPKEEITFILLFLLIISFQVCGPSGAWMLSCCLWKEMVQVPTAADRPIASQRGFLLFPSPKRSSCPWSFFTYFPCLQGL